MEVVFQIPIRRLIKTWLQFGVVHFRQMFCPLCKAEYRAGITQCGDCHVSLVSSAQEARSASVRLWKGDRQHLLDNILAALDAKGIHAHFEEIVNTTPQIKFFGIFLTPKQSTFEYEVWVLNSDIDRAREAIANCI